MWHATGLTREHLKNLKKNKKKYKKIQKNHEVTRGMLLG